MNPLALLPLLGVLLGIARVRYPRVPWLAAGSITLLYLLFLIATASWAAACWSCSGNTDTSRSEIFYVSTVFFGVIVGTTLVAIWLGARFSTMLLRFIGTLRGRD